MPSTDQQTTLVKQTLKDFAKGIESGDFSSLMSNASKEFKAVASPESLKDTFGGMIGKKTCWCLS